MNLSAIAEAAIFGDAAPARSPEALESAEKALEAKATLDKPAAAAAPEVKPEPAKGPSLFDAIKAEREAREAKVAVDAERESLKKQAEEASAKLKDIDKAKANMMLDAVGYLQKFGMSEKEIALFGESIMYWLVPDKAPDTHRARLIEAQRYRDQAAEEDKRTTAQREAEATKARETDEYYSNLETQAVTSFTEAVKGFAAGTYTDSQAWFAEDHDSYAQSLLHTAKNLADAARKAGTQADLSIPSVAKALEADLSNRFKRVRGKPAQQEPTKQTDPARDPAKTPDTSKLSPEKQRIARAAAAAFGA